MPATEEMRSIFEGHLSYFQGFPLGAFLRLNSSESVVSGAKTVPKISFYKNKFDKITYNSIVNNNILLTNAGISDKV